MEQTPPRRRPPRQKLKMPLFGDLMGGSGNSSTRPEKSPLSGKITPLIFLGVLVVYGIDYLTSKNKNKVISGPSAIKEMAWNGKITKKWANVIDTSRIHYLLEITRVVNDSTTEKQIVDLVEEKGDFWDKVSPKNTVQKKEGSLDVTVQRYFKKDTVIQLQYP
ncbi:MAG: hypothetical protein ACOVQ4_11790 [Flectobacillus sp.]|uniref:hypothetical protein n=1 Tax=Flectobacillus sp. TaxID=50419 RepID=UPI003B9CA9DC